MKFPIRFATFAAVAAFVGTSLPVRAGKVDILNTSLLELKDAMQQGLTSEALVQAYLKRIEAYDKKGPTLNTVIFLNPNALAEAKALDAERKAKGPRSPLHGIPVVIKDNYETKDMPTTAGSQMLEGWIAPKDCTLVERLRAAGAVVLAKVNLSEFAAGGSVGVPSFIPPVPNGSSSAGGQTLNPHDLSRGPAGSSGGTGAAVAAGFAPLGMGSDTGGSIRGPCSVNGIAGLKPSLGLLSRAGIVPLALSFDTGGPMVRNVADIAVSLDAMVGPDKADAVTARSEGKLPKSYVDSLKRGSLKGAKIGVARNFFGKDSETDRVIEASIAELKALGAEVIDVTYPDYLMQSRVNIFLTILNAEFKAQIADYLKGLPASYPKTLADLAAKSNDPAFGYRSPPKAAGLKYTNETALSIDDPLYLAARDKGLPLIKAGIEALFAKYKLDAMVYPTGPRPATPIIPKASVNTLTPSVMGDSPSSIANMVGWPDLIVPAGMTKDGLPVTLSFFGPAFSEAKLLGFAYDYEQATKAIKVPVTTPALATDIVTF